MPRHINVLGPLPPPFGGVSIHIIRFLELLKSEGLEATGHSYTGTTKSGRLARGLQALGMIIGLYFSVRSGKRDILHIHYGGLGYFLALSPLLKLSRARKVITFHSVRVIQDLEERPGWVRGMTLSLLNSFDLFVPVRAEIGEELRQIGLTRPALTVMPAFLPPAMDERDLTHLPAELAAELTQGQDEGRLAICCAAYYLGPGYGQDDLYGVEELGEALVLLDRTLDQPLDLWVLVSNRPDSEGSQSAQSRLENSTEALTSIRVRVVYGVPLIPVMARCAGFLRPSREDGDSVAIREAMSMGLPVLASNVVNRPPGTTTFTLGGPETLARELANFLSELQPVPPGTMLEVIAEDPERLKTFVREVVGNN